MAHTQTVALLLDLRQSKFMWDVNDKPSLSSTLSKTPPYFINTNACFLARPYMPSHSKTRPNDEGGACSCSVTIMRQP